MGNAEYMGSHIQTIRSQCTRFLLPLPSSPLSLPTRSQWPMPQPQLITNQPHTSRRSSPLSHSPTNTELLMTTATDSSLMSLMREPQSTHQSPRRDTAMLQHTRPQLQLTSPLQPMLLLPKNLEIPKD